MPIHSSNPRSIPAFYSKLKLPNSECYWINTAGLRLLSISELTTKEEKTEATKFQHEGRRKQYLGIRAFLRDRGFAKGPILNDEEGAPILDNTGSLSISHKESICGFATSLDTSKISVGFDVETTNKEKKKLKEKFLNPEEQALAEKTIATSICTEEQIYSMLFAAKEALFKAVFPIKRKRFYFESFHIESINMEQQRIEGTLQLDDLKKSLPIHFHISKEDNYVLACCEYAF